MLLSILENALMSFILEDDMSNSAGGGVFFFGLMLAIAMVTGLSW